MGAKITTDVIYRPRGRAQEFAESSPGAGNGLACNLYQGCVHGCRFCFVPCMKFMPDREVFNAMVTQRKNILKRLEKDAKKLAGTSSPVFLCFTCDPYPPYNVEVFRGKDGLSRYMTCCGWSTTSQALEILEHYNIPVSVLSKGGMSAKDDLLGVFRKAKHNDQLQRDWRFGQTILFTDDDRSRHLDPLDDDKDGWRIAGWEPHAADFQSRQAAIQLAHDLGIFTWVSIEPVINTEQALDVIDRMLPYVKLFKVGKLNHGEEIDEECARIERETDWRKFTADVKKLVPKDMLYLKKSLQEYA